MRRQLRIWIGAFNACDPRFYSKGTAKPDFMFRVGTCVRCDRPSPSFFEFGFRRAKGTLPPHVGAEK